MQIRYPDYYTDFSCIAGACEDTCCAGWEIAVDQRSLQKYAAVCRRSAGHILGRGAQQQYHKPGLFSKRLLRDIKWRKGTFRQCRDGRCAFLRDDGLCDMYLELGADSLCKTCRSYPRHIEEFENVREITLSISCPEAARMLMGRAEPVRFLEKETAREESYEEFDYFLFSALTQAREIMLRLLQNRSLPIDERLLLVLGIAHDLEVCYRRGRLGETDEVLMRAQSEAAAEQVKRRLAERKRRTAENYAIAKRHFYRLCGLERLRDDWDQLLIETQMLLYVRGAQFYAKVHAAFAQWAKLDAPMLPIWLEQLAVYFISTYFLGAVYDGRIYGKADTAVAYVAQIYDLLAARWLKNEKQLDSADVTEIVYRYSREIEHSDPNLEAMEKRRWWPLTGRS